MRYSAFIALLAIFGCNDANRNSSLPTSTTDENLMTTPVKDIHSYAEPSQAIMQHLVWQAEIKKNIE